MIRLRVLAVALTALLLATGCRTAQQQGAGGAPEAPPTPGEGAVAAQNVAEGCVEDYQEGVDYFPDKVEVAYAQGWDVRYEDHYKVVTTTVTAAGSHAAAQDRVIDSTYVLVQCGTPEPELTGDLAGAQVIQVPARTMVDGGSSLYAAVERLGIAGALVGHAEPFFGETEAPHLPEVAARIEQGAVREIGYEVNFEALADADPDFYTNYAGDNATFDQIRQLGIPLVLYFPYTESPLGAAEQVKFLSLLFNLEGRANEIFEPIEQRYLDLRERVAGLEQRPAVLIGVITEGGDVTTRQRQRFEPQLVREAGGEPVPDLEGGGIATVSLERFLEDGAGADFWMDLVFFPEYETTRDYLQADSRLGTLRPLREGRVFHRIGPRGFDYFLSGAVDADLMLADVVSILHPALLPDHELAFLAAVPAE